MQIETSFASQLYAAARRLGTTGGDQTAAPSSADGSSGTGAPASRSSFSDALAALAGDFVTTLQTGENAARDALLGQGDVQSVVEALTATELALETAVTVRDRVVEAYQEILRMPI